MKKEIFDFIHHLKSRSNIEELGENYGMKNYQQKPDNENSKRNWETERQRTKV